MAHGDDRGLRLPPLVAPQQVVIVPIYRETEQADVLQAAAAIRDELKAAGVRVRLDDRAEYRPGFKFNEWELKGAPVRIELGGRDLAAGAATVARRDTGEKQQIPLGRVRAEIQELLTDIQTSMFRAALHDQERRTLGNADSYPEMIEYLREARGFVSASWCGSEECEARVKDESSATIRCLPLVSSGSARTRASAVAGRPRTRRSGHRRTSGLREPAVRVCRERSGARSAPPEERRRRPRRAHARRAAVSRGRQSRLPTLPSSPERVALIQLRRFAFELPLLLLAHAADVFNNCSARLRVRRNQFLSLITHADRRAVCRPYLSTDDAHHDHATERRSIDLKGVTACGAEKRGRREEPTARGRSIALTRCVSQLDQMLAISLREANRPAAVDALAPDEHTTAVRQRDQPRRLLRAPAPCVRVAQFDDTGRCVADSEEERRICSGSTLGRRRPRSHERPGSAHPL